MGVVKSWVYPSHCTNLAIAGVRMILAGLLAIPAFGQAESHEERVRTLLEKRARLEAENTALKNALPPELRAKALRAAADASLVGEEMNLQGADYAQAVGSLRDDRPQRELLVVRLPKAYTFGHVCDINLDGAPNRTYAWKVNGNVVLEGEGKDRLLMPLTDIGRNTIEIEVVDRGVVVAEWKGDTEVHYEAPVPWDVAVGQTLAMDAQAVGVQDFRTVAWRIDGVEKSAGPSFTFTPDRPGRIVLECVASDPKSNAQPYWLRRIRFDVNVR